MKNKRCGAMPGSTEPIPRLLSTHLSSQLLLVGNSQTLRGLFRMCVLCTRPITIGAIYGFTGAANVWSAQARRGLELARDEINAAGGIHGRSIKVIFEDNRTTPQGAVGAFKKLVNTDHVHAVVGDIFSFLTLPLVPLAQRSHIKRPRGGYQSQRVSSSPG